MYRGISVKPLFVIEYIMYPAIDCQIDQVVYALYGLTVKEIALVGGGFNDSLVRANEARQQVHGQIPPDTETAYNKAKKPRIKFDIYGEGW